MRTAVLVINYIAFFESWWNGRVPPGPNVEKKKERLVVAQDLNLVGLCREYYLSMFYIKMAKEELAIGYL